MFSSTALLSRLQGSLFLGLAPGYALGGYISVALGQTVILWTSAGLLLVNVIYTIMVVPETLTTPEINEVHQEQAQSDCEHSRESFLRRIIGALLSPLSPLKHLIPVRYPQTGRRNPRLLLLAIGVALYTLGSGYLSQVVIIYSSNVLYFNAEDVSRFLSLIL